jgi:chromosome segregation ATPase
MKTLKYQQIHSQSLKYNLGGIISMIRENRGEGDVEQIGSLKEKLLAVSNEIDAIKNSFSKNTEDLSKIQNMLSVEHLDEIGGILETFESRVEEAEKRRNEAADGARKYSEELEKEKERLIKLWDAYKNQEEELSTTEKKVADYEERVRIAETSKKQLEDDLTARINTLSKKLEEDQDRANRFDEYKQRSEELDSIRNQLEYEMNSLRQDNANKENTINDLNQQISELRNMENYAEYKEKYEGMAAEYEKEKERLTKLYHLYEETETECKSLSEQNKNWQNWYNANKDIFNRLFSTAPPISITESPWNEPQENTPVPDELIENKPKKTKKKFRLK